MNRLEQLYTDTRSQRVKKGMDKLIININILDEYFGSD